MADFHFSQSDVELMLQALVALRECNVPEYLDNRLDALERKLANAVPYITAGELRNICLGLELLLEENPLDWKAVALLKKLRAILGDLQHRTPRESQHRPRS